MNIKTIAFALLAATMVPPAALAGVAYVATPVYTGQTESIFSLGIQFDFGDMQPEVVGSFRHTKTDTGNDVTGGKLDLVMPVLGEDRFMPKIRAMGLIGSPDVQGEVGIGFDFATQQPLVGLGVQAPYAFGGLDVHLDGEFHPFVGVGSYDGAPSKKVVSP
jgi:hypothetical protein